MRLKPLLLEAVIADFRLNVARRMPSCEASVKTKTETKTTKGTADLHFLDIVDPLDREDSLRDEEIVCGIGILPEKKLVVISGKFGAHQLVEDVVVSLDGQLEGDPRLLQQVSLDVRRRDFVGRTKVDADELTLTSQPNN